MLFISASFIVFIFQYLYPYFSSEAWRRCALVARSGSGSCMRTADRTLRTPGLDVKAEESSGQVLSTSVARICTEVFIHTINHKPPGATGLWPLVSTLITSLHHENIYFFTRYAMRPSAVNPRLSKELLHLSSSCASYHGYLIKTGGVVRGRVTRCSSITKETRTPRSQSSWACTPVDRNVSNVESMAVNESTADLLNFWSYWVTQVIVLYSTIAVLYNALYRVLQRHW